MTLVWRPDYNGTPGKVTLAKESVAADPYYNNVSLLLHGDGANGSTTIVDSSSSANSVIANDGAQISTAIADPFGGSSGSIEFLSSPITGLSVDSPSSIFQFGTGDWTIEAWIYQRSQHNYSSLIEIGNHLYSNAFTISIGSAHGFYVYSGGFYGPQVNVFTLNTWQHVAVTRAGNALYFFLNGTIVGSSSGYSFTNNLTDSTIVSIGYTYGYVPSVNNTFYQCDGYIDDLRITKGVARYTSNFTPPTAPFPEVLG